ncbi:MAG TPA: GTP-binding protein, partial [bacterium]
EVQVQQVESAVKSISLSVPILRTQFAEFPLSELDKVCHPTIQAEGDLGEGRPDPVASITLEVEGDFTRESWDQFRNFLGSNFMRMKGFVSIDQKSFYVDATMDQFSLKITKKTHHPKNRLVLIGRKLDEDLIHENFLKFLNRD